MPLRTNNKLGIRIDIALAILIAIAMFLFNYINYVISYNIGLKNELVISIDLFIYVTLFCIIIILAVIIIYIYRLCIHLKTLSKKAIYFRILFIILLLSTIFIEEIYVSKPGYIYTCRGFSERMHREADIPAIQSWLETVDTDSLDFKQNYAKIKESEWPDSIVKLYPKDVYFERYNKDKTRARLLWGGTLVGRWGLVVGNKSMTMTISDIKEDGEYRMQFEPGAYIWYDD